MPLQPSLPFDLILRLTTTSLLGILRKNRRKLSLNPTTRAAQEPIETEFSASMVKLTPLKAKITASVAIGDDGEPHQEG